MKLRKIIKRLKNKIKDTLFRKSSNNSNQQQNSNRQPKRENYVDEILSPIELEAKIDKSINNAEIIIKNIAVLKLDLDEEVDVCSKMHDAIYQLNQFKEELRNGHRLEHIIVYKHFVSAIEKTKNEMIASDEAIGNEFARHTVSNVIAEEVQNQIPNNYAMYTGQPSFILYKYDKTNARILSNDSFNMFKNTSYTPENYSIRDVRRNSEYAQSISVAEPETASVLSTSDSFQSQHSSRRM